MLFMLETVDPRLLSALKRLDYLYISNHEELCQSPYDYYLWVRSAIVLGNYTEAARRLERCRPKLDTENFLCPFLQLQISIYDKRDLQRDCLELLGLKVRMPLSDYLIGEYHFVLGYLYILLDEYRQATRHNKLAAESYQKISLDGCAAHALFNLCVCNNHLNERSLFEESFARLELLQQSDPQGPARLPYLRMKCYRLMDREQYLDAFQIAREALELCEAQSRVRDSAELACLSAFILLKQDDEDEFEILLQRIQPYRAQFPSMHLQAMEEYERFAHTQFIPPAEIRKTMERWRKSRLNSVHSIYLLSLLCDRMLRARDYEVLGKIARLGGQWALQKQQALCLVDFRPYEIVAALRTGQTARAAAILSMYRKDAADDGATLRLELANGLETELKSLWPQQPGSVVGEERRLELDSLAHEVRYRGQTFDVSRKPIIEQFLVVLMRAKSMLPLEQVFEQIYKMEFNPLLHERRFNSLVDRTRTFLRDTGIIVRREGCVGLSPAVEVVLQNGFTVERTVLHRRGQLLKAIAESERPLTISELEKKFACSRRTLQFDLRHLLENHAIASTGGTRGRRYYAENGHAAKA